MLRRLYVLFFIELGSRRVYVAGCTSNPSGGWVVQQARNLSFTDGLEGMRLLIRDRDSKFTAAFDEVFRSEGLKVIHTPVQAPQANAYAERFVRTVRTSVSTGC
jgi:transposase InsO family protein